MRLLDGTRIRYGLLAELEVQQRLTTEEIDLEVPAVSGILHQEVNRALRSLDGHDAFLAMELTLGCEAVAAVQITGMCHEEAERLHHRGLLLEIAGGLLIDILRKELSLLRQLMDIREGIRELLRRCFRMHRAKLFRRRRLTHAAVDQMDRVISQVVGHMNACAVYIENDVITIEFILMNHEISYSNDRKSIRKSIQKTKIDKQ